MLCVFVVRKLKDIKSNNFENKHIKKELTALFYMLLFCIIFFASLIKASRTVIGEITFT